MAKAVASPSISLWRIRQRRATPGPPWRLLGEDGSWPRPGDTPSRRPIADSRQPIAEQSGRTLPEGNQERESKLRAGSPLAALHRDAKPQSANSSFSVFFVVF